MMGFSYFWVNIEGLQLLVRMTVSTTFVLALHGNYDWYAHSPFYGDMLSLHLAGLRHIVPLWTISTTMLEGL